MFKISFLLCLITYCFLTSAKEDRNYAGKVYNLSRLSRSDKRFLRAHNCKVTLAEDGHQSLGMSRWKQARFQCDNLAENPSCVVCEDECWSEDGCSVSTEYKNKPVLLALPFRSRIRATRYIRVPVACLCVPKGNGAAASGRCENATE